MTFAGVQYAGRGLGKPGRHNVCGFIYRKWLFEDSRVRGDPQKSPKTQPCESEETGSRQRRFQPLTTRVVLVGTGVIGVQKEVGIDENHRCCGPSTRSRSSPMLSIDNPGAR